MENETMKSNHIWKFSRIGGVNRVNLTSGEDLKHLDSLNQKLWTALSCPVNGLEIDPKTLELIDTDNDGRIRVPEVLSAVKWIISVIKNPDDLLKSPNIFPLSAINETEEGKKLLISAKQILTNLEKPDSQIITVDDTSDTVKIFAKTKFNGDGIITAESTDNPESKNFIADIILCFSSIMDRSGKPGISQEIIDNFYKSCNEYSEWYAQAEKDLSNILPFGDETENALNIYNSVKLKIEDYFLRCKLAEFDKNSADTLNLLQTKYEEIRTKDLVASISEIATYPLSKIEAHKSLNLMAGINPAWSNLIESLKNLIIKPLFGEKTTLSETEWKTISSKFDAFTKWKAEKKGVEVEKLGLKKIREILASKTKEELIKLIEADKEQEDEANYFASVNKMVRLYRDLFILLQNFVTFHEFYSRDSKAVFQSGTLYIDQRSCDLCIKVSDMAKHSVMAHLSGMYLIYCDCVMKSKNEKMTIVAAMTQGDIDNLMIGRNAIFYDRKGQDWDATITKIIENPISIRQAFWSPYKKIAKLISDQIEKMAAARDSQIQEKAAANVDSTATKIQTTEKVEKPQFDMGKFVGIFAAVGLAIGVLGSAIAALATGFLGLKWWQMPLSVVGLMLLISGPAMLLAWLKLRKRNLAPVLDANGWAINVNAKINIPFGKTLSQIATLPKNSKLDLKDPYKKSKAGFYIFIIICLLLVAGVILLWQFGFLKTWGIL